jgi:hypothetical protein
MHQQVRCLIRTSQDDSARGALDAESLVEILTLLKGTNLRSAGRSRPDDGGGERFVFSVDHRPGDDTADQGACDILIGAGFEAKVFPVDHFDLAHHGGTLLEAINDTEAKWSEPVIEVYIGAAERNGKIPVQLVTRSMVDG